MTGDRDGNGRHSQEAVEDMEWHSGQQHPEAPASQEECVKVSVDQSQGCECNRGDPDIPPQ
jgi:hypothetical protein